uniref:AbrB/MazE/SpoVT family DNA-binding domain-containing protein n=1 Tax=uncultured Caulobacter sp. TaxID=158749 RepID=UPI0025EB5692|nr:AbrB/MazE/SpoVT family DNA-binding domain-containing protein [uncultured Caulobacter sp.]
MIVLKAEQQGDDVVLVPNDEARERLAPQPGDIFVVSEADGDRLVISKRASQDERFERGKAFLERYRSTFEDLAK